MTWTPYTIPFTKYTDFVGEIRIPNLTPSTYTTDDPPVLITENVVGDALIAELQRFITKYEKRMLVKLLSQEVYDEFVTQMTGVSQPDAKWTDLYTAIFTDPIIASYVYYWYMRDVESSTGSIGEVYPNAENAARVSASTKMARAWNEMSEWLDALVTWILENEADYGIVTPYETDLYAVLDEFRPINTLGI